MLVTKVWIVDQILLVGDDGAGVTKHLCQTLRDRHIVIVWRGSANQRRERHTSHKESEDAEARFT
jgi:hypothetical protein